MPRSLKYLGAPGFETYVLHLMLFLEETHEGNCWIFDLEQPDGESSIQYQVQLGVAICYLCLKSNPAI